MNASLLEFPPDRLTAIQRRLLKTVNERDWPGRDGLSAGPARSRVVSFQQSPQGSASHAADARSPPDTPDKVGIRRLSGMSCWSRLNAANSYDLAP